MSPTAPTAATERMSGSSTFAGALLLFRTAMITFPGRDSPRPPGRSQARRLNVYTGKKYNSQYEIDKCLLAEVLAIFDAEFLSFWVSRWNG